MGDSSWVETANVLWRGNNWLGQAGTALASSVTETIISVTAPDFTVGMHFPVLAQAQVLRIWAMGEFSNTGTPTLQFRVRYGGVAGVVLLDTTALTTYTGASHDVWELRALIACRAVGASGAVMPVGYLTGLVTNKGTVTPVTSTGSTTPAQATVDTTAQKTLVLTAQWGTNSASNSVTCHVMTIEAMA